jgi:hypothetical protein
LRENRNVSRVANSRVFWDFAVDARGGHALYPAAPERGWW